MEFLGAGVLTSSVGTKIASAVTMAKVAGTATGTFITGLSSQGLTLASSLSAMSPAASAVGSAVTAFGTILPESAALTSLASSFGAHIAIGVVGGGLAVASVPVVLSAVGFTGAGITASSLAAKMMSVTAIANGGGVPAGSLVATLQSVGAAGLTASSKAALGTVVSTGTAIVAKMAGL